MGYVSLYISPSAQVHHNLLRYNISVCCRCSASAPAAEGSSYEESAPTKASPAIGALAYAPYRGILPGLCWTSPLYPHRKPGLNLGDEGSKPSEEKPPAKEPAAAGAEQAKALSVTAETNPALVLTAQSSQPQSPSPLPPPLSPPATKLVSSDSQNVVEDAPCSSPVLAMDSAPVLAMDSERVENLSHIASRHDEHGAGTARPRDPDSAAPEAPPTASTVRGARPPPTPLLEERLPTAPKREAGGLTSAGGEQVRWRPRPCAVQPSAKLRRWVGIHLQKG